MRLDEWREGARVRFGEWRDALEAACLAFLGVLCIGAVLLFGLKLQFPSVGSGFDVVSVVTAITIAALGSLGVPLHFGDLVVSAIPLGALLASGVAISWATRLAMRRRDDVEPARGPRHGAKVAIPFALLCWIAALIFRLRSGDTPVSAGAGEALFFGAAWGALFGALGGLTTTSRIRNASARRLEQFRAGFPHAFVGFSTGCLMLVAASVLALFAALIWVILGLARGTTPPGFGLGDAIAAIIYGVAFLPNVVVTIVGLSVGAPVEIGSPITAAGRARGSIPSYSLLDWGEGAAPGGVMLLVLIPVLACAAGGYMAFMRAGDRSRVVRILSAAAVTVGVLLFVLAALGEARLGAGLLGREGFARLAVHPPLAGLMGAAWAGGLGFIGWKIAEMQAARSGRNGSREETKT